MSSIANPPSVGPALSRFTSVFQRTYGIHLFQGLFNAAKPGIVSHGIWANNKPSSLKAARLTRQPPGGVLIPFNPFPVVHDVAAAAPHPTIISNVCKPKFRIEVEDSDSESDFGTVIGSIDGEDISPPSSPSFTACSLPEERPPDISIGDLPGDDIIFGKYAIAKHREAMAESEMEEETDTAPKSSLLLRFQDEPDTSFPSAGDPVVDANKTTSRPFGSFPPLLSSSPWASIDKDAEVRAWENTCCAEGHQGVHALIDNYLYGREDLFHYAKGKFAPFDPIEVDYDEMQMVDSEIESLVEHVAEFVLGSDSD
ncbi:hypothetical protein DL93DRAFT_615429 [Clavulina sp. PMI_390]|nr:hypothetical protein DL93DRAFT_615429 [Clavulina sp. PMI_390]